MTTLHGVALTVAYDGTEFHGWQAQHELRTVQGALEAAVRRMVGEGASRVRGASRTDAGVHAEGQVAAFDCPLLIPPRGWTLGLNGHLPDDVAIVDARVVAPGYTPRFDAKEKLYHYRIYVGPTRDPLRRRVAWHLPPGFSRRDLPAPREGDEGVRDVRRYFDVDAMREAARSLEGEHDFHAFRAADDPRESTVRTMHEVSIHVPDHDPSELILHVRGNAFMKNMVRILAGTLVDVGAPAPLGERCREALDRRRATGGRRPHSARPRVETHSDLDGPNRRAADGNGVSRHRGGCASA